MKPKPRAFVSSLLLTCTLVAAPAAASAQTLDAHGAASPWDGAASQNPGATQRPAALEPHVFHLTFTDRDGNLFAGVGREDLTVTEGGEPREVVYFRAADVPASVMFLVDTSSSAFGENRGRFGRMRVEALKDAVAAFLEGANPSNEYFVTAFNKSPQILLEGSTDARAVSAAFDRLASANLKGFTALDDAL